MSAFGDKVGSTILSRRNLVVTLDVLDVRFSSAFLMSPITAERITASMTGVDDSRDKTASERSNPRQ